MIIEEGKLYFIKDEFMDKYGIKYNVAENKELGIKRPCYFCFKDRHNDNLFWFVPLSKQYDKYEKLHNGKKDKLKREPLNFVFGKVKGEKSVFLIQNIFPCLDKYIEEKYVNNNKEILVAKSTSKNIIDKAKIVINMAEHKNINIAFTDILKFKEELLKEML